MAAGVLRAGIMTRRVHIVGCRRSGTTLLMELMWLSFEFSGRHAHEISVFEPIPEGETLYLTKKPPDTIRIGEIFQADPNLHVIAMLRDPRAVITSKHKNRPDVYFSGYFRWKQYVDALEAFRDHPRFILIRYEDLLIDPDATQCRINAQLSFLQKKRKFSTYPLGVEVSNNASNSLNGVRPFDISRIDGWKNHLPRVNGQLRDHPEMIKDLIDAGYEETDDWVKMLEGEKFYSQNYKDSRPHILKRFESNLRYRLKIRKYLQRI